MANSALLATLILGCCTCAVWSINDRLREVFSWQQVDFVFPDQATRQAAIDSGAYIQANNLPLGLEVWRDKLFITVPRWKTGVASTLNYVSLGSGVGQSQRRQQPSSPPLVPYPSYAMNRLPRRGEQATDHIVNTFRLSVDACDRLWVVDMAAANGTAAGYGDPKLLVIDLNTDRVVRRFTISSGLRRVDGTTWFPALVVDSDPSQCDRSFAYLPDLGWGMVVYSFRGNSAWRLDHPFFHFDPLATVFNIGGVPLEWTDGVFGVALSPPTHDGGNRTLYFHAMASTRLYAVDTWALRSNRTVAETFYEYRHLGYRAAGMQAASLASDPRTGVLFYALVNRDAVGCWNPARHDRHTNATADVVAQDSEQLQFPGDLKVDSQSRLWVLSDRMPVFRFRVRQFDLNDVNYRVLMAPVAEAVGGTRCEPLDQQQQQLVQGNRPTGRPTQQGTANRPSSQQGTANRPSSQQGTANRPSQQSTSRPTQQFGGGEDFGSNGNQNTDGMVWAQRQQEQRRQQQDFLDEESGSATMPTDMRSDFDL